MHNKWGILGLYCAFSLLVCFIDSLMPPNGKRLQVVKMALHSSAIAILFNADVTCDTCQFPLRVVRIFSLYVISFVVTLVSYALFYPNGSQWSLPEQIARLLVSSVGGPFSLLSFPLSSLAPPCFIVDASPPIISGGNHRANYPHASCALALTYFIFP